MISMAFPDPGCGSKLSRRCAMCHSETPGDVIIHFEKSPFQYMVSLGRFLVTFNKLVRIGHMKINQLFEVWVSLGQLYMIPNSWDDHHHPHGTAKNTSKPIHLTGTPNRIILNIKQGICTSSTAQGGGGSFRIGNL